MQDRTAARGRCASAQQQPVYLRECIHRCTKYVRTQTNSCLHTHKHTCCRISTGDLCPSVPGTWQLSPKQSHCAIFGPTGSLLPQNSPILFSNECNLNESVFPASLSLPIAASALLLSRAAHTPVHSTFLPSTWKGTLPCTLTGEFKRTSLSCHLELEREEAVSAQ